jgi:hypothetical protein
LGSSGSSTKQTAHLSIRGARCLGQCVWNTNAHSLRIQTVRALEIISWRHKGQNAYLALPWANRSRAPDPTLCRLLITTRDGGLVSALGAQEQGVDVLNKEAALGLLATWSECEAGQLPVAARDVANECGYLPLALAMCGALARDGVPRADIQKALLQADLTYIVSDRSSCFIDVYIDGFIVLVRPERKFEAFDVRNGLWH